VKPELGELLEQRSLAFYPGCVATSIYPGVIYSSIKVLEKLGFKVSSPEHMICCGLPLEIAGMMDRERLVKLADYNLRNFIKHDVLVTPCNGCYRTFNIALEAAASSNASNKARCLHVAEVLWSLREELREVAKTSLEGLNVVTHVGCHYVYAMPSKAIRGEEGEDLLEDIALSLGMKVLSYEEKATCCGATAIKWPRVLEALSPISKLKVTSMVESGADLMVVMCTACQLMLDRTQYQLWSLGELDRVIPVLHVSQLVGLALGLHPLEDVGLHLHLVKPLHLGASSITGLFRENDHSGSPS